SGMCGGVGLGLDAGRRGDGGLGSGWSSDVCSSDLMVRPGAAVVGAGVTMDGRRVVPDVDEAVAEVAGWITPRLGGVGPTTRAMLLRQTVETAERRSGVR